MGFAVRQWLAASLLASAVLAAPVVAADSESSSFDLRQLIERAQRDNKSLQAARYAVDIGRARLVQAGMRENPRLDVLARSDFLFSNDGEYGGALAISQSFPIAGRILRQKDVARVDIALAEAEVAEAERRLAGEVAADAYRLMVVDKQIASRGGLIEIQSALARTTRDRFKAAEVSELDVNTVQLDLQRLIQERELLQAQRDSLLVSLNTRLGRPAGAMLVIDEPLPKANAIEGLANLQAKALELRPDWHAALLSVDRAQAEQALARSMRWEDWSAGLELSQDKQVIEGLGPQGIGRAIGVSLSIPLPLFNKNQGKLAEADATHEQALARIAALRLDIAGEVASAHGEAARLQAALAQYEKNLLPISTGNVHLAQQGYRQGLIPVFDVVQAQRQQADLNSAYLTTLDQFLQALVRLHTSVGDYLTPSAFGPAR